MTPGISSCDRYPPTTYLQAELEEAQQQALPAGDAETTLEAAAASEG